MKESCYTCEQNMDESWRGRVQKSDSFVCIYMYIYVCAYVYIHICVRACVCHVVLMNEQCHVDACHIDETKHKKDTSNA